MTVIKVLVEARAALHTASMYDGQLDGEDLDMVNSAIKSIDSLPTSIGQISDGYHTFDELYEHRIQLWITLCRVIPNTFVWRSKIHSDGTKIDGWFVLGMKVTPGYQITYHLPMSRWGECEFAAQTMDSVGDMPEFDGHTSADVLERLRGL